MKDYNCDCRPHYPNGAYGPVPPFWGYSNFTPTIPKLYWDVPSQEQRILNLFELLDKLICYCNKMGMQIDINSEDIEKLKEELQRLEEGGLLEYYEKQIYLWIQENMRPIMSAAIKQAYFGLTNDGYFCAYVPTSWNQIKFDTGAIFGTENYGRLILRFDAVGQGIINNTDYDSSVLTDTIDAYVKTLAGDGLKYEDYKLNVNTGNGIALNPQLARLKCP